MDRTTLEAVAREAEIAFSEHQQSVRDEAEQAAREARDAVRAKYHNETSTLSQRLAEARKALSDHIDATATHEWEGQIVTRTVWKRDWNGREMKDRPPKSIARGIVEVRRSRTAFPANVTYGLPAQGEAFVRLLKKDGTPGTKFESFNCWRSSSKWSLENASGMEARQDGNEVSSRSGDSATPKNDALTPSSKENG